MSRHRVLWQVFKIRKFSSEQSASVLLQISEFTRAFSRGASYAPLEHCPGVFINSERGKAMKKTALISAALVLWALAPGVALGAGPEETSTNKPSAEESYRDTKDFESSQEEDLAFSKRNPLNVGDDAPDFRLTPFDTTLAGPEANLLSKVKAKPVVLIFGSATCGLTADKGPELRRLYDTYGDKADFAFVYMKDAHPSGDSVKVGQEQVRLDQPRTMDHRLKLTQHLLNRTQFTMPVYVDDMLGSARKGYYSFHLAAYIIDANGKLAFLRNYKYDTQEIESSLKALLGNGGRMPVDGK